MPVRELFEILARTFGAREEGMRAMAAKADFISSGGKIRLRNESESDPK